MFEVGGLYDAAGEMGTKRESSLCLSRWLVTVAVGALSANKEVFFEISSVLARRGVTRPDERLRQKQLGWLVLHAPRSSRGAACG